MHDVVNDLYDMCDIVTREIGDANEKIRAAGGKLTNGDVDYIDKLTHSLKSIETVIAMKEGGYSNGDMSYRYDERSHGGRSYGGRSYDSRRMMSGRSYGENPEYMGRGDDYRR